MAITIPSGYIKICEYSINDASERNTKKGKILKSAFRIGPSNSIITKGKIVIDSDGLSSSEDEVNKEKPAENNKEEKPAENNKEEKPAENNKEEKPAKSPEAPKESNSNSGEVSNEKPNESYNYSMLEAYFNMRQIYEADEESPKQSNELSDEQSDSKKSSDGENEEQRVFKPGSYLYIMVWLPREGCSVWHVQLDKRSDINAVKAAIQAKKFKTAHITASKGLGVDGLIPLSVETYISAKAESHAPFIGYCRYAMDSGSEDSTEDSNTICIAIAPIDGRTGKPSESTVYKASYNIIGDISNGEIDKNFKQLKKDDSSNDDDATSNNKESSEEELISDQVSKWLNSKFRCVGDQSMYDNFLKLRGFVTEQIAAKNLEYVQTESETPNHYSTVSEVKNSLIYY